MNTPRQDAWSKDEDIMLAETVLRYIRDGKTQLEAFKEVGKKLVRTSAACGFRWNATIRKQYHSAIQLAKEERKQNSHNKTWNYVGLNLNKEQDTIDTAILLLKKMKVSTPDKNEVIQKEQELAITQLKTENKQLKEQLLRYDDAWIEMRNLWNWVKEVSSE